MDSPTKYYRKLPKRVASLIQRHVVKGKFTLSSGVDSEYYVDLKPVMMSAEGLALISQMIVQRFGDHYWQTGFNCIAGLEMGAIPLISGLLTYSFLSQPTDIRGLIIRKTSKVYGTKNSIEGLGANDNLHGKRVLILDDVSTTGHSIIQAVNIIQDAGGIVVKILSVVDINLGAHQHFEEKAIPFSCLFQLTKDGDIIQND